VKDTEEPLVPAQPSARARKAWQGLMSTRLTSQVYFTLTNHYRPFRLSDSLANISPPKEKETLGCVLLLASDDFVEPGYVSIDIVPLLCASCDMPLAVDITSDATGHAPLKELSLPDLNPTHSAAANTHLAVFSKW
jgi:hypothetical protein